MDMAQSELYDPNRVFDNEPDQTPARVDRDEQMYQKALKALEDGKRVKVTTPDEYFYTQYIKSLKTLRHTS